MSYASNLLSRGEEIVYESRQHWFAVVAETFWWIIGAVLLFALTLYVGTNRIANDSIDGVLTVAVVIGLLLCLGRIGLKVLDWRNQEWLITNRRVIRAEGILNKAMSDSNLEKINDAMLSQSWMGRIFNYGTLDILTAAEETGAHAGIGDFPMLADPVRFKIAMLNQKELLDRPDLAPPRRARAARRRPSTAGRHCRRVPARTASPQVLQEPEPRPLAAPTAAPGPAPSSSPAADTAARGDDPAATLERLGTLRDKGLITAEEYETKKQQILERF